MKLRTAALGVAIAALAPLATASFALASPRHDGQWRVQIVTEQGWCGVHQWQIGVRGGRVIEVGAPGATANGRIAPNGQVSLQIARGEDILQTSGVVNEKGGGGAWTLPNRSCTGRWSAVKS